MKPAIDNAMQKAVPGVDYHIQVLMDQINEGEAVKQYWIYINAYATDEQLAAAKSSLEKLNINFRCERMVF